MKRIIIAAAILLVANNSVFAQTSKDSTKGNKTATPKRAMYTCTMHPEVVMDKPGKCPKCGMTLVKMKMAKSKPVPKTR